MAFLWAWNVDVDVIVNALVDDDGVLVLVDDDAVLVVVDDDVVFQQCWFFLWNIQALEMGYWLPMLTTRDHIVDTRTAFSVIASAQIWTEIITSFCLNAMFSQIAQPNKGSDQMRKKHKKLTIFKVDFCFQWSLLDWTRMIKALFNIPGPILGFGGHEE